MAFQEEPPFLDILVPDLKLSWHEWIRDLQTNINSRVEVVNVIGTTNEIDATIYSDNETVTLSISDNFLPVHVTGVTDEIDVTGLGSGVISLGISSNYEIEDIPTTFTDGSIPFADTGKLIQDNPNLFWDDLTNRLGLGKNSSLASKLDIEVGSVSENGISIKEIASQTGYDLDISNSSGDSILRVWPGGHISNVDGISTEASEYGVGLWVSNYDERAPVRTDGTGSYDHTGGTQEQLFTKTAGADFTSADLDRWIRLTGSDNGPMCEIKTIISTTQVIVDGLGWDKDFASQTFYVYEHPVCAIGDGNKIEFSVNGDGEFEIYSYDFTGSQVAEIKVDAAANDVDGLVIECEANGYNNVIGQRIAYVSGALAAGEVGAAQVVSVDSDAAADDTTVQIGGTVYLVTGISDAVKDAIVVLPGFTRAFDVLGANAADPAYGYETTSGTSIDRVNSGGAGNDAFVNAAVNEVVFTSNGDNILIGSASTFEIIQFVLSVFSKKNLDFNFYYSITGGTWTLFTPQADNTNGFTNNGSVTFSAADLAGWSADDEDLDGNAITNAYYIALERTYSPTVATLPTEEYFKIYASQETGMYIDGQGFISYRISADTDAPASTAYYSSDSGKPGFKDAGGTFHAYY